VGVSPTVKASKKQHTTNKYQKDKKRNAGATATNIPKRENKMEAKVDRLNNDDPQLLRPPKKFHHAPSIESASTKQHLQEGMRDAAARTNWS
jgi:hypothetical protein